ncbi:MAG: class I SAM-dependent methyltransferase [Candidatus Korobacteraceae bacterium]
MSQPEFDRFSGSYEEQLKDPIRDRFMGSGPQFFHLRKRDLIREYFGARGIDTRGLRYLDIGCGKGELLSLLRGDFLQIAGCDPSPGMLSSSQGVETRVQEDSGKIPFADAAFDFVTAVCVYHHVPPSSRLALTREAYRVLRPGGVFAIVEHNPYNPVTRLIVSRTPVDADAMLLRPSEAGGWMRMAGFSCHAPRYFLYFPEPIYRRAGDQLERLLRSVPLGGQYAIFGSKRSSNP